MDILEELRRVIRLEARALTHLEESLSSRFEEAVRMLQACQGKVILMGVGKSGLIANKIAATMVSTGTPAVFLHGRINSVPRVVNGHGGLLQSRSPISGMALGDLPKTRLRLRRNKSVRGLRSQEPDRFV